MYIHSSDTSTQKNSFFIKENKNIEEECRQLSTSPSLSESLLWGTDNPNNENKIEWNNHDQPIIWSPTTNKWGPIKKYSMTVKETEIEITENGPGLERLKRLEYLLHTMACEAKKIILKKNKEIDNLQKKNKIATQNYCELRRNAKYTNEAQKKTLQKLEEFNVKSEDLILDLNAECEELHFKNKELKRELEKLSFLDEKNISSLSIKEITAFCKFFSIMKLRKYFAERKEKELICNIQKNMVSNIKNNYIIFNSLKIFKTEKIKFALIYILKLVNESISNEEIDFRYLHIKNMQENPSITYNTKSLEKIWMDIYKKIMDANESENFLPCIIKIIELKLQIDFFEENFINSEKPEIKEYVASEHYRNYLKFTKNIIKFAAKDLFKFGDENYFISNFNKKENLTLMC